MGDIYKNLADAIGLLKPEEKPLPKPGTLGYTIGDNYMVKVAGDASRFYVRFNDGSVSRVPHRGNVSPKPNLPVIIGEDEYGDEIILGTDPKRIERFNKSMAGYWDVGLHSHERFSGNEFPIDLRLIQQLAVRPVSGLTVRVESGRYDLDGIPRWFEEDTLDLTPYVPGTADQHRWCIVGLTATDPATITTAVGTPVSVVFALEMADAVDIAFDGFPLAGVKLRNGQTSLTEHDFESFGWLYSGGGDQYLKTNPNTIDRNVTIPSGRNLVLAGPIVVTATLTNNGRLVIL